MSHLRDPEMTCRLAYVTGYRKGEPCPYRASEIVLLDYSPGPFLVCGYHARAYAPGVRYPLHWNLTWIRKMQRDFGRLHWERDDLDAAASGNFL